MSHTGALTPSPQQDGGWREKEERETSEKEVQKKQDKRHLQVWDRSILMKGKILKKERLHWI